MSPSAQTWADRTMTRGGVVGLGLPGEAGDDVRAQSEDGQAFGNLEHPAPVRLACVPAPHRTQDRIRTALEGHVEVRCQPPTRGRQQLDQAIVHLGGLHAA